MAKLGTPSSRPAITAIRTPLTPCISTGLVGVELTFLISGIRRTPATPNRPNSPPDGPSRPFPYYGIDVTTCAPDFRSQDSRIESGHLRVRAGPIRDEYLHGCRPGEERMLDRRPQLRAHPRDRGGA